MTRKNYIIKLKDKVYQLLNDNRNCKINNIRPNKTKDQVLFITGNNIDLTFVKNSDYYCLMFKFNNITYKVENNRFIKILHYCYNHSQEIKSQEFYKAFYKAFPGIKEV